MKILPTKYLPSISYRLSKMYANICVLYPQATVGHPSLFSLRPPNSLQGFRTYFNNSPVAVSPLLFSCQRGTKIGNLSKVNANANANVTEEGECLGNAQTPKTEEERLQDQTPKTEEERLTEEERFQDLTPKTELERFQDLRRAEEKFAKFHVYVHDILGGSNATVWEVARSPQTAASATAFGQVRVTDDLLTIDPDPNSEILGRVQGTITYTDMQQPALTMNLNFYFTAGEYRESCLCIIGRNPISKKSREMPVVGGTGIFRMARGYCISNTHSYDAARNIGVLIYTFYVAYYVDKEEFYAELMKENGNQ